MIERRIKDIASKPNTSTTGEVLLNTLLTLGLGICVGQIISGAKTFQVAITLLATVGIAYSLGKYKQSARQIKMVHEAAKPTESNSEAKDWGAH